MTARVAVCRRIPYGCDADKTIRKRDQQFLIGELYFRNVLLSS